MDGTHTGCVTTDHFETFRALAAELRDGEGLPGFVEREFHKCLQCGALGAGFARFRCDSAFRTASATGWLGTTTSAAPSWAEPCERSSGSAGVGHGTPACETGAAAHRAAIWGGLNLNVHFHALVVDGVFAKDGDAARFHPSPWLDAADVDEVLATVEAYTQRLLASRGVDAGDDGGDTLDEWADDAPVLAGLAAASVQGRAALGPRAGARVRRRGVRLAATEPAGLGPCHARHNGFDLHAGLCLPADERDRLERIARYALRPPVAQDRLEWTADGQVRLGLRRAWSDGTTQLLFDPPELLERLAALTPRPRINLILYHGVLAPRAAWRALVVQFGTIGSPAVTGGDDDAEEHLDAAARGQRNNYPWAALMRRSLGLDVLACPRCGGRLTLIALIDDPAVIRRVLQHLGLPTEVPELRPARAPPVPLLDGAPRTDAPHECYVDDPA